MQVGDLVKYARRYPYQMSHPYIGVVMAVAMEGRVITVHWSSGKILEEVDTELEKINTLEEKCKK